MGVCLQNGSGSIPYKVPCRRYLEGKECQHWPSWHPKKRSHNKDLYDAVIFPPEPHSLPSHTKIVSGKRNQNAWAVASASKRSIYLSLSLSLSLSLYLSIYLFIYLSITKFPRGEWGPELRERAARAPRTPFTVTTPFKGNLVLSISLSVYFSLSLFHWNLSPTIFFQKQGSKLKLKCALFQSCYKVFKFEPH